MTSQSQAVRMVVYASWFLGLFASTAARAQIGVIDGGYWSGNQYLVVGWACDQYSDWPVSVVLTDGNTGAVLGSVLANDASEPAVGNACGVPWAGNLRFHIALDPPTEESVVNEPIAVYAISNFTDFQGGQVTAFLSNSWVFSFPDNRIRGVIDGWSFGGGTNQLTVYGWACAAGIPQSVAVHVYAGQAGSGIFLTAASATQASEPAVAQACGVSSGSYRFTAVTTFGPEVMLQANGVPLYVYGISPIGASNLPLYNSGLAAWPLPSFQHSTSSGNACGCLNAQWDAPRGALVLINSGSHSSIRPIIDSLGETYTHEMIVQGPGSAAQSEYQGPTQTSDCDHPIDVNSLEVGFPGMEKSMNTGAIFADIYGNGLPFAVGSNNVIWQLGDPARATAIADALDAKPSLDVPAHGDVVHRILRNGAPSPYGLYQYMNIEGTHLGDSGSSTNNTSVSSTFCSYAYALGGPPMTAYNYFHQETVNAANAFWNLVYNNCRSGLPWYVTSGLSTLLFPSCQSSIICNNAAAMIVNCMALGGSYCGQNNNFFWQSTLTPLSSHAYSISPDRLGGLTRFATEVPRPTTWASDTTHPLVWNWGGRVCGCFD